MKSYAEADDGAIVPLALGDSFAVRLPENPATGYHWRLAEWDRSVLDVTRDEFQPPAPARPGAGGEHVWEFVTRGRGRTSLHLERRRRWEEAASAKTFRLEVSVT